MSAGVKIICCANIGKRPHRYILASIDARGAITYPEGAWVGADAEPPHEDTLRMTRITLECPEHGRADVTANEITSAHHEARRTNRRTEIRVSPTPRRWKSPPAPAL